MMDQVKLISDQTGNDLIINTPLLLEYDGSITYYDIITRSRPLPFYFSNPYLKSPIVQ